MPNAQIIAINYNINKNKNKSQNLSNVQLKAKLINLYIYERGPAAAENRGNLSSLFPMHSTRREKDEKNTPT